MLWDGLPKSRGSIAGMDKRFSSSSEHPGRFCDPLNLIQRIMRLGREAHRSPPFSGDPGNGGAFLPLPHSPLRGA
jgi:hypothetical protein